MKKPDKWDDEDDGEWAEFGLQWRVAGQEHLQPRVLVRPGSQEDQQSRVRR